MEIVSGERGKEYLLAAFATDDGKNLADDHFGMAKYFYVYRFLEGREELVDKRKNARYAGDESMPHGDPKKARATASAIEGVDVIAARRFGPNIKRLENKFVCVVTRVSTIAEAVELIRNNIGKIKNIKSEGKGAKCLVLKPD
ncbi:MAG: hypothetical protein B1H08_00675 [Candidatus Omnitrophica bacterium 4484_171]|nr:MAG: hypothetical protein B1H08_00675 [Candidatus Omnitrophica bacterium 4484_171]